MAKAPAPSEVLSHWFNLIEGLQASPMEFYASVEAAVQKRQIADVRLSRVDWKEAGLFSAKREYLRVRWKEYLFDICGAPYGGGFFVSWWLGELEGCLAGFVKIFAAIPGLNWFIGGRSYYQVDSSLMFQESIRLAVNDVVDQMTTAKGLRALTADERKPILGKLARR